MQAESTSERLDESADARAWPWVALAIVAGAFLPVLGFGFVRWDDPLHLLDNGLVLHPGEHSLRDHLLTPSLGYPTPITVLTYRLEFALVGLRVPALYHATNLVLHLTVCWLVGLLARMLGMRRRASAFAMLIFGLHPVVAEPVAWVSGRKDLLALVFALISLLLSLPSVRRPSLRRVASVVAFALALACKPVAAWVAVVIPFLSTYGESSAPETAFQRVRSGLLRALPHLVLAVASVGLAMKGQRAVGAVHTDRTTWEWLREAWYALGHHLDLLFLVQETCAKYLPDPWPAPFTPRVDLAPIACALVLAAAYRTLDAARRKTARIAAWLALASYLPSSNLVPLVRYLADTYVHGPLVGLSIFVALLIDRGLERGASARVARWLFGLLATLLVMLLLPSEMRFHDSVSLWQDAFEKNPHDYRICQNLTTAHYDTDGPAGALAAADMCIARFGPEHFEKNRGIALFRLGRSEEARMDLEHAAERRPDDPVIQYYLARLPRESDP